LWLSHRRERKKPVSGRAAAATLSKLAKFGADVAIKAICTSIENDYQGIFPERESTNGKHKQRASHFLPDGTRPGEYAQPDGNEIPW